MEENPVKVDAEWQKYTLDFKFDAGTSRGVLKTKDSYFLKIWRPSETGVVGWGEAGPLPKLSPEDGENLAAVMDSYVYQLRKSTIPWSEEGILDFCSTMIGKGFPSLRFAFETALLDLYHGGKRKLLDNAFYDGQEQISINGLIWMGDTDFMLKQIEDKLDQGFSCIKMKIGAINFEEECRVLGYIRSRFSKDNITLRVDANGAFLPSEAMDKLRRLAAFDLHSIEQPIKAGQYEEMRQLCASSPLDIALDEDLIGIEEVSDKAALLDTVRPPFIILKPTLVGGIRSTREWIALAEERNIGWWMTSALESNIGLNAIAQLTSAFQVTLPQGLGTGQLYRNNVPSPLTIGNGSLSYHPEMGWGDI
ncbi:o-succinylbenzoate synthase [Echinicola strongylocentroti]|nr:o-succinylbenzoate synthase [Echinicola strongylocentroti]